MSVDYEQARRDADRLFWEEEGVHPDLGRVVAEHCLALLEELAKVPSLVEALSELWDHMHPEPKMDGASIVMRPRIPVELVGKVREALAAWDAK